MTLNSFLQANGIVFTLVFGSLSLAALGLCIWRLLANFRAHTDLEKFVKGLQQQLAQGGPQAAFQWCQEEPGMVPKLFVATFKEGHQGKMAARDAMADCIELEIMPSLNKLLPLILLFAKVAPMLGLLGTVWGMISAFQTIAGATRVDPSALANDIGMALFTTAEGLIIAIPLIFAYTLFKERVHRFEVDLQRGAQIALKMLPEIHGRK